MDKTVCPYCDRKLVSPFSCRRHIKQFHPSQPNPYTFYPRKERKMAPPLRPMDEDPDDSSEEEGDTFENYREETEPDTDSEPNTDEESEQDTEEETEDEDMDTGEKGVDPWLYLLENAIEHIKKGDGILQPDDLLHEPSFSILLDALKQQFDVLTGVYKAVKKSHIFKELQKTLMKMHKKGLKIDEAMEATWDLRKHMIKLLLKKHSQHISEKWDDL
jgi:hypothetical protein